MNKEILRSQTHVVEFKSPLKKGNVYTDYTVGVSASDVERSDKETLQRLNNLFPLIKDNLSLSRTSTDITIYNPNEGNRANFRESYLFTSEFEGEFIVPWKVNLLGVGDEIIVGYEVNLIRPDSSHAFKVVHTKIPEFNFIAPFSSSYNVRKNRTQLDGLPVYLRLDEWEDGRYQSDPAKAKKISIISRQISPTEFEVKDENEITVVGQSRFEGSWREGWGLNDYRGRMEVGGVSIKLKGHWI